MKKLIPLIMLAVLVACNPTGQTTGLPLEDESVSEVHQQDPITTIKLQLIGKGYHVGEVSNSTDTVSATISTRRDAYKDIVNGFTTMYNNIKVSSYRLKIVDYNTKATITYQATRPTLRAYFSGQISKQEFLNRIQ